MLVITMNKIKLGTDKLQVYLLAFPHFLQTIPFVYPILCFNIFKNILKCRDLNKFFVGFLLIFLSFFSLIMRDGGADFIFSATEYYLGIVIFYISFKLSDNLKIDVNYSLLFSCLILLESLLLKFNISIYSELLQSRTFLDGDNHRALGPALNSSISAVIMSTIFFYYVRKIIILKSYKFLNFFQASLFLFCFLLCFSLTGIISFIILFIYFGLQGLRKLNIFQLIFKKNYWYFLVAIFILLIVLLFLLRFNQIRYLDDYIYEVLSIKYIDISDYTFEDLFFGMNLSDQKADNIGGDFAILRFADHCGLIFLLFLLFIFFGYVSHLIEFF